MENKKRKGKDDGVLEEEEEEMMNKFYTLLRRFRDARDGRRKELEELQKSERKKKRSKVGTEQHHVWVPSFELEDFINEAEFRGQQPLRFPTSSASPSPRGGATNTLTLWISTSLSS
ncbi:hypothetical protein glysoja_002010 [Glycine soja]|nr:hypothetical protein glysoja_002010 [Glycine soja]